MTNFVFGFLIGLAICAGLIFVFVVWLVTNFEAMGTA
jgi:tetrahydromethanopterin S-methyltransferase subunit B